MCWRSEHGAIAYGGAIEAVGRRIVRPIGFCLDDDPARIVESELHADHRLGNGNGVPRKKILVHLDMLPRCVFRNNRFSKQFVEGAVKKIALQHRGDLMMKGKVALVTGAGSGIGKAAAIALAKEGYAIGALGRTASELDELVAEVKSQGGTAKALIADVADPYEMAHAIDQLTETFSRLDVVVANAGINGVWAPIEDLTPEEWDNTITVNLRGTYLTLNKSVPHLKAAGGGSIIIVSSINGTRTFTSPGATAYSATKAGQLAMAQQLALELGQYKIRVNAICPGAIETKIDDNTDIRSSRETAVPVEWPEGDIPITGGKAGLSEDVADLVVFLAGDKSRHITGTPVWIDGGQGLLR